MKLMINHRWLYFFNVNRKYISVDIRPWKLLLVSNVQARNQKSFRAREISRNLDTSIIILSQKHKKKKVQQGKFLEFFLLDTLKTTFWMENLTQRWIQSGPFLQNEGVSFDFQKKAG